MRSPGTQSLPVADPSRRAVMHDARLRSRNAARHQTVAYVRASRKFKLFMLVARQLDNVNATSARAPQGTVAEHEVHTAQFCLRSLRCDLAQHRPCATLPTLPCPLPYPLGARFPPTKGHGCICSIRACILARLYAAPCVFRLLGHKDTLAPSARTLFSVSPALWD